MSPPIEEDDLKMDAQLIKDPSITNAEIADHLARLAQLLSMHKANPYKVKAYRRAATTIRTLGESLEDLVRGDGDLTVYPAIGDAIAAAIREIVLTGGLSSSEKLKATATPAQLVVSMYPRLDSRKVLRVFEKLNILTKDHLQLALQSGAIEDAFGSRIAQHVRQGLIESTTILLYHAHSIVASIESYLLERRLVSRVEPAGDYRRRVEVLDELTFLIETEDFSHLLQSFQRFAGGTKLIDSDNKTAVFALSDGPLVRIISADWSDWGRSLVEATGNFIHLDQLHSFISDSQLSGSAAGCPTEQAFFDLYDLQFIPPELREGLDEIERASKRTLPILVQQSDIVGDLHTHTIASDGSNTIEAMAIAALELGYKYIGITDHSQSLKIAGGVSEEELWSQIKTIDTLNEKLRDIRILKSAEVDILADGSLDYPDELLRELDYTVCSIHSRFAFDKQQQTERIMRAMDNWNFTILGHATGRLLLKRPGYDLDIGRIIAHAKENGCFFEINSSPDRLDLSAENARLAAAAGVPISISTDAHSKSEFKTVRYGIEQARRAGIEKASVLNCMPLSELLKLFARP